MDSLIELLQPVLEQSFGEIFSGQLLPLLMQQIGFFIVALVVLLLLSFLFYKKRWTHITDKGPKWFTIPLLTLVLLISFVLALVGISEIVVVNRAYSLVERVQEKSTPLIINKIAEHPKLQKVDSIPKVKLTKVITEWDSAMVKALVISSLGYDVDSIPMLVEKITEIVYKSAKKQLGVNIGDVIVSQINSITKGDYITSTDALNVMWNLVFKILKGVKTNFYMFALSTCFLPIILLYSLAPALTALLRMLFVKSKLKREDTSALE